MTTINPKHDKDLTVATTRPEVSNIVRTRIPTDHGDFMLYYYTNTVDEKEHIAFVKGQVEGHAGVPVRIHSECFTGDVLGSRRCDCRDQLHYSMSQIGDADRGILIYLRQEGRGIGLLEKLKAYNLQDEGFDTVDANIQLGHRPDERNYKLAAMILEDLNVGSVKVITNNPMKISELSEHGIRVEERIPIEVGHHNENADYLRTKVEKMSHMLSFSKRSATIARFSFLKGLIDQLDLSKRNDDSRPFVTVSYAQSIDGSIASQGSDALSLSCRKSLEMTHFLRSSHDCLLVGINTVLTDDPQLNVRFCDGPNPQPVILDSMLRFPADARLLNGGNPPPIILTTDQSSQERRAELESRGARVLTIDSSDQQRVLVKSALQTIRKLGFTSLMVEGGASIIGQFLGQGLTDYCIVTIVPRLIGGLKAVDNLDRPADAFPLVIDQCRYQQLDSDIIAYGEVNTRS